MPTEQSGEVGDRLRGTGTNFWDEFGTTTGRLRRCGWLDGVILRYASQVNGFTELYLTKLDVLSGLEAVRIAVAYDVDNQRLEYPPSIMAELERAQPVYETLPGWDADVSSARRPADLPEAARAYIQRVEALCAVPVRTVSVGPARDQIVRFD
jgi:adenylosuccinate synthase